MAQHAHLFWKCPLCGLQNHDWDSECAACFSGKPAMASGPVYNWGIVGCGKISHDFTNNLDIHSRAQVVACAARRVESAQEFAKKFDIPPERAYGSYEELANDPDIQVVYVGTIHPCHYENVMRCLNAGKHVVCEKPLGMNSRQVDEMYALAEEKGLLLLEGMWTRFFPGFKQAQQWVASGAIGDLVAFHGDFGKKIPKDVAPRLWDKRLGGGSMLDLGIYVVAPIACFFGLKQPSRMTVTGSVEDGVDTSFQVTLNFDDAPIPQYAQISSTLFTTTPEEWIIAGTKGRIHLVEAHHPTQVRLVQFDKPGADVVRDYSLESKRSQFKYEFNFSNGPGFTHQIDGVTNALDAGRTFCAEYTPEDSKFVNKMMEDILQQLGVSYDEF